MNAFTPEELSKMKGRRIDEFKLGKYTFFRLIDENEYGWPNKNRFGFVEPFDLNRLSTMTRRNVETFIKYGWKFDSIIFSPIRQYNYRITYSIFIQGTDWNNKKIVYARVETSSVSAGQTFIYWEDCFRKMTDILNNIPVERRLAVAEKEGNKEEIIKISVEELF